MCIGPWLFFVALYIIIYTRLKQVNTMQIIYPTELKKTQNLIYDKTFSLLSQILLSQLINER